MNKYINPIPTPILLPFNDDGGTHWYFGYVHIDNETDRVLELWTGMARESHFVYKDTKERLPNGHDVRMVPNIISLDDYWYRKDY